MRNKDRVTNGNTEAEATGSASEAQSEVTPAQGENFVLSFKRNHPQDRASYGIQGVSGIVVVQRGMVFGTVPVTSNTDLGGMPATITVNVRLADPKASNTEAKAAAAAAKAQEKADKAAAKLVATEAKVAEKAAKAAEALAKAQAKLDAAKAAPAVDAGSVEQL